jgi:hypothetical protein
MMLAKQILERLLTLRDEIKTLTTLDFDDFRLFGPHARIA